MAPPALFSFLMARRENLRQVVGVGRTGDNNELSFFSPVVYNSHSVLPVSIVFTRVFVLRTWRAFCQTLTLPDCFCFGMGGSACSDWISVRNPLSSIHKLRAVNVSHVA